MVGKSFYPLPLIAKQMSGKVKDMTGQQIGDLVVLERDMSKVGQGAWWICHCNLCNQNKSIKGQYLRSGTKTNCGCLRKKYPADLTGIKFGRLTPIQYVTETPIEKTFYNDHKWLCKCDCDNTITVFRQRLVTGGTTSCGCNLQEFRLSQDLTGQIFGELTALYRLKENYNGQAIWHCQCSCGKELDVMANNLKSQKSCGCKTSQILSDCRTKDNPRTGDIYKGYKVFAHEQRKDNRGHNIWHIQVECPFCDDHNLFWVEPCRLGQERKSCGCLSSSAGEAKIALLLKEAGISFKQEKAFDDCYFVETLAKARFDFYVDDRYLIEFDGRHHFVEIEGWRHEGLAATQKRDAMKNQYALEHNIPLIRIPYTHYNNLCIDDLKLETSTFIIGG